MGFEAKHKVGFEVEVAILVSGRFLIQEAQ